MSLCFPTLCPDGTGDFTDPNREHEVTLHDALEHYTLFADKNDDGSYYYRFASHHTFPFWIFNRSMRHTLLEQTNVYARKNELAANITLSELRDEIKKETRGSIFKGLHVFQANFPGTTGFWYKHTQNLLAASEQLDIPTLFWTISFPDYHLNELQSLMPWSDATDVRNLTYKERKQMVNANPQLAATYFHLRAKAFTEHLNNIFQVEWFWSRIEAQRRASLHQHACLKAQNDHDLVANCAKALLGFLAQKKISNLNAMDCSSREDLTTNINAFSTETFRKYQIQAKSLSDEILAAFESDYLNKSSSKCQWYIGVRAESIADADQRDVLSGKEEMKSARAKNLINLQVVKVWNNLPACLAWSAESSSIKNIKQCVFDRLANVSSVFGHGCTKPNKLYTLTLLRGFPKATEFSAYNLPNTVPELMDLIEAGRVAEKVVCDFADYVVSTWNPSDQHTEREMPNPHPATYNYEDIDASESKEKHIDVVNAVNRHYQCGPWCERLKKKTNVKVCRYHFPFNLADRTHLRFEEHSRNAAGEVFY
jgi:hypothetical protein